MTEKKIGPQGLIAEHCDLRNVSLGPYVELGTYNVLEHVTMGDYSYTGQFCILQNAEIGKFVNIAAMVRIGPTHHPMDRPTLHHITYRRRMYGFGEIDDEDFFRHRRSAVTVIGHDTWIGHGAIVMPGVTVGDGAVVGSGAVVTKDVEPYTVVAGVPARILRRRFDEDIAASLARIKWWNWPHETVRQRLDDLAGDIRTFVRKYDSGSAERGTA